LGKLEGCEVCGSFIGGERIWEGPKELFVCRELEGDDEGCEEIECVLEESGYMRIQLERMGVLLGRGDLALWSSSCVTRKPVEKPHAAALFGGWGTRRRGGRGEWMGGKGKEERERKRAPLMR
jgi:hypothetical protein